MGSPGGGGHLRVDIAGVKQAGGPTTSRVLVCVPAHEGHILGKLVVLVLIDHLLHVPLAHYSAGVYRA